MQWTKDSVVLSRAVDPELSFSNIGGRVSLTIRSSRLDHEGKYMCTAKNAYGVATSSAQLVVRRMSYSLFMSYRENEKRIIVILNC